jgi:hypothetical protein
MTEAAAWAEISDSQRPFQDERAAHQFPPNCSQALLRQWSLVGFNNPCQDLLFPVGRVDLTACFVLQLAYIYYHARTLNQFFFAALQVTYFESKNSTINTSLLLSFVRNFYKN